MAGPLAVIASNAIKYVVSGSARRALTKVIAELNKHYAKSKTKRSAEAIREKAKRMVQKGISERSKVSKEIKQGGAFSQTSTVPLRLKGSGNVIPKTKTKIGSIPLKKDTKGKYSFNPEKREMLGSRKVIGDKAKNKKKNIAKKVLGAVGSSAKRNKGKLLVGAVAIGVTAKALNKDTDKKKTTTTKKTTTKKNTKPSNNKNFPDAKKETKTKRKVDHSSNYRKSKKSKKTSNTKSNVSAASRKKQKDNIVKTSYGGKVKTRYGFVRTGR